MKITLSTAKFQEMVSKSIKGASNNKMVPITELMSVKLHNNALTLITSDATNYLYIREYKVPGDDFEVVIRADTFFKLISKMTSETITLELTSDKLIVSGNGKYEIELPTDENGDLIEYPDPFVKFSSDDVIENVDLSTIKLILSANKAALATTLEVPCYTGYYVGDKVVSTDTYKICSTNIKVLDSAILINPEMMNLLDVMTSEKIQVARQGDYIMFHTSNCTVYGRVLAGIENFAIDAISQLVSEDFDSVCKVNKNAILEVLDRLSLFVGDYDRNEITLTFTDKGILCTNKKESGSELVEYLDSKNPRDYMCTVDIDMLTSQIKAQQLDSVEIWYGKPNAIKLVNGKVTQIVALSEE